MIDPPTTDESPTDAEAIEESLKTPASFARVFERHFVSVHRYLSQRLGPNLADEFAAQVFLVAFDRRSRYDLSSEDARPWLFGIATNLARHHWRAERRWLKDRERAVIELSASETDPAEDLTSTVLDEQLGLYLHALPRRDREALLLLAWGELTYEEIARALDVPIGTVRSRISRARRRLSDALGTRPPGRIDQLQHAPANDQGDYGG
jgi:RNA polymerase sigma factor (sigma-70 family)